MNGGREGRSRAPSHAAAEPPPSPEAPRGPATAQPGDRRACTEREGNVSTTAPSAGEGGTSLVKYCKVTLDRLPLGDLFFFFLQKTDRGNTVNKMFSQIPSSGKGPPRLPGKTFLVPKLRPLRTEKCVQKAFPLHRNLIMAWLHLLGFIHFYCGFHCPLLPDVFKKPESNWSGEGVLDPRHLQLGATVRGGQ